MQEIPQMDAGLPASQEGPWSTKSVLSVIVHICLTNDYKNTISHLSTRIMNTSQNIFNNFTHQMMINSNAVLLFFLACSQNCKKWLLALSSLSAWNNSAPTGWIFMKYDIWSLCKNPSSKIQVSLKSDKSNWYFTWRPTYIYNSTLLNSLEMRNILNKNFIEN